LYDVKYKVLNAVNYGVPQKRERVIIIGVLKKYGVEFKYPTESEHIATVGDALENVPKSAGGKYSDKKKELFRLIPQGGCWINLPEDKQKEYLGKSYTSGGGKRGILRRLSLNEPSLTILCSPSQKQTERCHPTKTRPFTIRESARIQTFPDEYEFFGSVASQYKQVGNAVPVKLAYKLGRSIVRCLNKCVDS
jgi:DNA (cytosine-5)-methyltransferase 1